MSDFEILSENQLLLALSPHIYGDLLPHLQETFLVSGQVVHKPQEAISEVYFPKSAIFSSVIATDDSCAIEVALVGNRGLVGLPAVFGDSYGVTSSTVQVSGTALKASAQIVREEFWLYRNSRGRH